MPLPSKRSGDDRDSEREREKKRARKILTARRATAQVLLHAVQPTADSPSVWEDAEACLERLSHDADSEVRRIATGALPCVY